MLLLLLSLSSKMECVCSSKDKYVSNALLSVTVGQWVVGCVRVAMETLCWPRSVSLIESLKLPTMNA